ncbi:glycosyltransferase family 39 protein [Pseudomonas sp. NPDC089422]|uniref:glycosyltransferase family 39 protein n=1 Tax=Pseudomonas sp. NPDC089422 TaxID=3364466 RepID=UPI00381FE8AA
MTFAWSRSTTRIAVSLILGLSAAVRLYQLSGAVIWHDEGFSVMLSAMPPGQILFHTARDVHPPLYYLLLHYWIMAFGDSVIAVRSMSVLAGVATVAVGMLVARRLASLRAALLAGLLLALFPFAVRFSQETRMYALLSLLLLGATLMLMDWLREPLRLRGLMGYTLLTVAGVYTHYFTVFAVLASWLCMACVRDADGRPFILNRNWWLANAVMFLMFLPWLPILYGQLSNTQAVAWIPEVTLSSIPLALWRFFVPDADGTGYGVATLFSALLLLVSSMAVAGVARRATRQAVLLFIYCFFPICAVWLASFLKPMFMERYLLFAAVALPILLALGLDQLIRHRRACGILLTLTCAFAEASALTHVYQYQNPLKQVVEQLSRHRQSGDLVIVDGLFWYYSVAYYSHGSFMPLLYRDGMQGDSSGTSLQSRGAATLLYPHAQQLYVARPENLAEKSGRVWWVVGPGPHHVRQLPRYWLKVDEIRAGGVEALLFDIPPHSP